MIEGILLTTSFKEIHIYVTLVFYFHLNYILDYLIDSFYSYHILGVFLDMILCLQTNIQISLYPIAKFHSKLSYIYIAVSVSLRINATSYIILYIFILSTKFEEIVESFSVTSIKKLFNFSKEIFCAGTNGTCSNIF